MSTRAFKVAAALVFSLHVAFAVAGSGLMPEDLSKLQSVSDPVFSPDGRQLVYSVETVDSDRDEFSHDLWTVAFAGGPPKQLTATPYSEWQPRYAENGSALFYLSDGGEQGSVQVWRMHLASGQTRQLTDFPEGVLDFDVRADGKALAVIAKDPERAADAPEPRHPKPIVTTRFQFKEDYTGYLDARRSHLYLVQIANGQATALTRGPFDHYLPAFSPDGSQIAFVSKRGDDPDRHVNFDLFTVEAKAGGVETQRTRYPGTDLDPYWETRPAWSPDGRKIAYVRSAGGKWIYYAPWQLAVLDLRSGREWQPALPDVYTIKPQWAPDSRNLYALVESPQAMTAVKVDTVRGRVTAITRGARFDYGIAVSSRGDVVLNSSTPNQPFELQRLERNGALTALTRHNAWLEGRTLASTEVLRFNSADGTPIEALLVKPLDYTPGKTYPMIVRAHGGPVYQFSQEYMDDWQVYANAGFMVLAVNPRGSSGRGFDFARAIYADWGNKDVQDVLAGVDYAVAQGWADPNRLGIGGWSYGGILSNYVIASDTRFKAAVSGAGLSNSLALYGFDQYTREYELELGTPWDNPEVYQKVSYPFLQAKRISTPTLFQCAEMDYNVPCLGAMQMYQALRSLQVPTQLVVYPGQNHGLSIPSYLLDRMQRNLDWYTRYLNQSQ